MEVEAAVWLSPFHLQLGKAGTFLCGQNLLKDVDGHGQPSMPQAGDKVPALVNEPRAKIHSKIDGLYRLCQLQRQAQRTNGGV